jgi:prepilin-type N-terminal cleavage/methylation domain-containing protein
MSRLKHGQRNAGFTLIELMITVAIVGVLASIGFPALIQYIRSSRTVEPIGFLAEVKARQESYRLDFGAYYQVSTAWNSFFPTASPDEDKPQRWNIAGTGWETLGAMPSGGESRFVYSCVAGSPTEKPAIGVHPKVAAPSGDDPERGYKNINDFWFITVAVGDLEPGGEYMQMESYSHTKGIWSSTGVGIK